jgi:two-component system sensor histidine kinase HydH
MSSSLPSSRDGGCFEALEALANVKGEAPGVMLPRLLEIVVSATASRRGVLVLPREDGTEAEVTAVEVGGTPPGADEFATVVPMSAGGSIHLTRAEPLEGDDLRWARTLADEVGMRLENARLYDAAQRRLRHVSVLLEVAKLAAESHNLSSVLDSALDRLREGFDSALWSVHLLTETGDLALHGYRSPAEPKWAAMMAKISTVPVDAGTLIGRAAFERRSIRIDMENWPTHTRSDAVRLGVRHGATTPLVTGDRLVGVLCAVRTEDPPFSADEMRMLESCAAQFAAVVEHARAFEGEQRRARDLAAINEVGGLMSQNLDLSAILAIGVRQATRISGVSRTELLMLEPEHDALRVVAAWPPDGGGTTNLVIPLQGNSLAQHAVATGKPVWTSDATHDRRAANDLARRLGHHAILAVPLIADGKPVGVIALCDKRRERRFSAADVETAVAIGHQLASGIANARLFDDLRRSYEKLAKAQQRLIGQERLAALGELAAVMAHEVRNPLAIIFNAIASLEKMEHPRSDARTLLAIVAEEAGQLNRIVGDLLDFARPHEPEFRLESLEDLVWAALESAKGAQATDGIEFAVVVDGPLPRVSMDARLLKQALINLVTNAIQALPSGGRIELHVARASAAGAVEVRVVDNGPGISGELGARVLQPFFTTKATGTGLGLAIVKRIAETHEGELILSSTPGGGTTSTLRIPLRAVSAPPARAG